MPIYVYQCNECKEETEEISVSFEKKSLKTCPYCEGELVSVFCAPQFRMKGGTIMNDTPYQWDDTALEGQDMCNPFYDKKARKSGEVQGKISIDGGHHSSHGAKRKERKFTLNGA